MEKAQKAQIGGIIPPSFKGHSYAVSLEQLGCYGEWYADFVLTVNKDVTFNADGTADGYLAGEYGTYGWISVPFTDFAVKANTPIKIMDTAAKLLGQGGLKLTYNDVYAGVKDFNCGVFFTKEFREANPDLEVNLSLKMFNKVNEEESYDIGPVYSFKVPENEIDSIGMGKMANGSASYFQTNLYDVSALNNLTVELWSDDVKIGETTWAKEYPVRTEKGFLTCAAFLTGSDEYWNTTWYYKNEALVPTKSVLKIDGEVADEWAYAGTANENITDSWNTQFPGIESAAAKIGDKKFATLQMALDAANTDDVVEVTKDIVLDLQNATHLAASDYAGVYYKGSKSFTLDLGGHTITAGEGVNNDVLRFSNINGIAKNTITVQNGTVISPATTWQAIDAGVGDGSDTGTILNLKNLTINSNRGGACAVRSRMGNVINITDTTINTVNGGGVYVPGGKAELTNVNITVTGDPAVGGYSPAIGACVAVSNEGEAIINSGNYVNEQVNDYNDEYTTYIMNSGGKMTIKGGTFTGGGKGMLGVAGKDAAGTLTIEGGYFKPNEALVYSEGYGKETVAIKGGEFTVDPTAYLATGYETTVIADGWKVVNAEEAKTEADTAYIQFKEVEAEEGTLKYEIVVVGANEEVINRLTTADLSLYFNADPINDNVKMAYKLKAADDITLTKPAADRYAFNFDGINTPSKTDNKIVLGTIEVSGYGTFSMGIKTADTNIVNSTTLYDNLVTTFVVGGDTDNDDKTGKLVVNEDLGNGLVGSIDNKLNAAPQRELTINVKFPNTVYDQAAAYMDMTVTISGGDLESAIVKNLGKATGEAISYVIEENLTKDFTYNVTIEGAGYRTYDCAVKMTGDKTLTFWNNVRTGEMEVEEGNTTTKTAVTFLAGDIVKDNNINIYDLSAVVSYFATNAPSLADKWDYAKYDLNRDGKIDSKDVAYILVSWGK